MYTEQNLYYLNQMGIEPWVVKTTGPRLLVLTTNSQQTEKEKTLLEALLNFMGLPKTEVLLKSIESIHEDMNQLAYSSLIAVLQLTDKKQDVKIPCPCFYSLSLKQLLANPKAKKELLMELIKIKQLL